MTKINFSFSCLLACAFVTVSLVASSIHKVDERELNNRIIGGKIANAKRYPYYTYVEVVTSSGIFTCGGSLVAADIILTAAHCVQDQINTITIAVNYTQDISTLSLTGYEYLRDVRHYFVHTGYDSKTFVNDIAFLLLEEPVFEVSPVNLNDKDNVPSDGKSVTAFGHGHISNAVPPENPVYLMEVSIPIISIQDCNDANSWQGFINDESMICAGPTTGGKGICQGDFGGPLIIRGSSASKDIQVGIVSFTSIKGCALADFPAGFTRVSYYTQWIRDGICGNSKFKPKYCASVTPQPTKKQPTRKPKPTFRPTTAPTKKIRRTRPPTPKPTEAPITPPSTPVLTPSLG